MKLANNIKKYGLNGAKMGGNKAKLTKNAMLPSNNGRNATRCQLACVSYTPIINYELVLPILIIVGRILWSDSINGGH